MNVMNELITALNRCLDRGEITVSSLAKQAGCTRQHIYGILEGKHQLSLGLAEKLASAVGFEIICKKSKKKIPA